MTIPPCPRGSRHCRYYQYIRGMGPRCEQEIDLSAPGAANMCMPDGKGCDWRLEYTEQERAARNAWLEQSTERVSAILEAIPENSTSGRMLCPACRAGTVQWVRARSNGHLHAGCSTPNCFSVLQ